MLTISDALAADLADLFLADPPDGVDLPESRIRFLHEENEPPCPRLVILAGEPKAQTLMHETALVPVEIHYITSATFTETGEEEPTESEAHRAAAGILDEWWRAIRGTKRRQVLSTRVYLHEQNIRQPVSSIDVENRERATMLRGDLMVTLVEGA